MAVSIKSRTNGPVNKRSEDHEAIETTMAFWQARATSRLNGEDGRQAIENIAGFFAQVDNWDRQDAAEADIRPRDVDVTEIPSSKGQPAKEFAKEHRSSCNPVPDSFAA
jgi:hypothetical protein